MRVFITVTIPTTRKILREGFWDLHELGDSEGVYVGKNPLGHMDGFLGSVVLCLDIPVEVFNAHELSETTLDGTVQNPMKCAFLPAAILNQYGKPQIYDHDWAGLSRRELLQLIATVKTMGDVTPSAAELQEAFDFFDEIGWLTPLRPKEEQLGVTKQ